ncbi:MAG: flagellar basal body P-ring formation chaperone FlgA [Paracoccaceae bacterium]
MIFTFFKQIFITILGLCFLSEATFAGDRFTGSMLKEEIIAQAQKSGVQVSPIISDHKIFYPCNTDLIIGPKFDTWETIQISCAEPYAWNLVFRSQVISTRAPMPKGNQEQKETFSYVVFDRPVQKGTVLSAADVAQVANFATWIPGAFSEKDQLIGRKLAQSVPKGAPILARHLTLDYAVEKNAIIDITLNRSGIEVTGKGIALSDGQIGEIISVSNLSSGTKLKALIKNRHQAQIISKQLK